MEDQREEQGTSQTDIPREGDGATQTRRVSARGARQPGRYLQLLGLLAPDSATRSERHDDGMEATQATASASLPTSLAPVASSSSDVADSTEAAQPRSEAVPPLPQLPGNEVAAAPAAGQVAVQPEIGTTTGSTAPAATSPTSLPSLSAEGYRAQLEGKTVAQLKDILRDKGLVLSGAKAALVDRLVASSFPTAGSSPATASAPRTSKVTRTKNNPAGWTVVDVTGIDMTAVTTKDAEREMFPGIGPRLSYTGD